MIGNERPKLGAILNKLITTAVTEVACPQLSVLDYSMNVLNTFENDTSGFMEASKAGWYWAFADGLVIVTERPTKVVVDDEGLPHNTTGPAIEYSDGFVVYCRHGVRIPPETVKGTIKWDDIQVTVDKQVQNALVEHKSEEWSENPSEEGETKDERLDAALAIRRLGGLSAVRGLMKGDEK